MEAAEKLLQPGVIGVVPTDTVYGVVARAADQAAVKRLYELKKREGKPGTVVAASIDQLVELGIKRSYLKAVEQFWPGAVSVVIPCGPELEYLHMGKRSLAVRIPKDTELQKLLAQTGALLTSSANHPGQPPANTIQEAQAYFGEAPVLRLDEMQDVGEQRTESYDGTAKEQSQSATQQIAKSAGSVSGYAAEQASTAQKRGVDFYVDGGNLSGHEPSTVIRIVDDAIEVLRAGAVKISENGEIL